MEEKYMTIKLINKENSKEIEYTEKITIGNLLEKEGIETEKVVIKQNGKTVSQDEIIQDNDEIEIIKVIYGG